MKNEKKIIVDGTLVKAGACVIPAESRGVMYGDGCFETLRSYAGRYLHIEKHLRRFKSAADFLGMEYPYFFESEDLRDRINRLLEKNGLEDKNAVIRFQLWRKGKRGYRVDKKSGTHFSVIPSPLPEIRSVSSLALVKVRRIPDASLPSVYKLSNNINYIAAAREAKEQNADDALMQTVDGFLSETTIANIFWITEGIVYTPSADECDLLPGITRSVLIKLCRDELGLEVREGKFKPGDLHNAEAAWVCNSVREIVPVSRVGKINLNVCDTVVRDLKAVFKSYKKNHLS